jgi:hypothetical protein
MELRNLPRFRIMEYLQAAGGVPCGEMAVDGGAWIARLEEMVPAVLGRLQVRRDMLIIEGDDEAAVEAVQAFMRQKTMRGGG